MTVPPDSYSYSPESSPVNSGNPDMYRIRLSELHASYFRHGIDDVLRKFALAEPFEEGNPRITDESDIDGSLFRFARVVSRFATETGQPDYPLIRRAFETILDGMNIAASEKFGYEKPDTAWGRVLVKTGIIAPRIKQYFSGLDDRYWEQQFPWEYREEKGLERDPGESDRQYLARHIHRSFHGFALAPFSYIQQATRSASSNSKYHRGKYYGRSALG